MRQTPRVSPRWCSAEVHCSVVTWLLQRHLRPGSSRRYALLQRATQLRPPHALAPHERLRRAALLLLPARPRLRRRLRASERAGPPAQLAAQARSRPGHRGRPAPRAPGTASASQAPAGRHRTGPVRSSAGSRRRRAHARLHVHRRRRAREGTCVCVRVCSHRQASTGPAPYIATTASHQLYPCRAWCLCPCRR